MRNFGREFGGIFAGHTGVHHTVDLGQAFQSADRIALAALRFVTCNPAQITNTVVPVGEPGHPATCFRYSLKRDAENESIADLREGRTKAHRTWGFGQCFLYMRNVQGHRLEDKRIHGTCCELDLNLRINPRRRIKCGRPEELSVSEAPNAVWSMDFMGERLAAGRQLRFLKVLDNFSLPAKRVVRSLNQIIE